VINKANSIAIPAGFNPRDPASVAAALALLPDDGLDSYSLAQSGGANLIGPALLIERLVVASGPSIQVVDYNYGLTLPAESFEVASGGFIEGTETTTGGESDASELVIYYGTTQPLSTLEGTVMTDNGTVYSTTTIQGINALTVPFNTNFDGAFWIANFASTSLDLSSGSWTIEFFGMLGSSLPVNDYQGSGYGVEINDSEGNRMFTIDAYYFEPNQSGSTSSPVEIVANVIDDDAQTKQAITPQQAIELSHFAIQQINGTRLTVHLGGANIYDQTRTLALPAELNFYVYSFKVDDTALGQFRISDTALYGADGFTPPSPIFFEDPE
jgi:hypothetical protein